MKKKILVLGATGAMGCYLVPELLSMGYAVDGVTLDHAVSDHPDLRYILTDASKDENLFSLLQNEYAGIVDFLIYSDPAKTFLPRRDKLLESTGHYLFLSSYRVYADRDAVTTEESPRLLDVSTDKRFLALQKGEYSLYKALGEDILRKAARRNYSIIRPAITYSKRRFQLVTLEAPMFIRRIWAKKTVLLPKEALSVMGTMSWAGDVARMIARLLLNPAALGETYTAATAEHHTWGEIADYYRKLAGLSYEAIPKEDYIALFAPQDDDWRFCVRAQLEYDRMFDRVMDNRKILNITGMKQSELTPFYDGLKKELSGLPRDVEPLFPKSEIGDRMDKYIEKHNL